MVWFGLVGFWHYYLIDCPSPEIGEMIVKNSTPIYLPVYYRMEIYYLTP